MYKFQQIQCTFTMDSFHPEQCDLCYTLRFDTYCNQCRRHLCNACHHGHACRDEAGLIAEQQKQKQSYRNTERTDPAITKYECEEHKSEYNRFCGTCGVVVCHVCCLNTHADHQIESVPTASKKCGAIVKDLVKNLQHDIETAVKLVVDLQEIISKSEKQKQIKDVTDLTRLLETTLVTAVTEKQSTEERDVSSYIKQLEKCISAWDKNKDNLVKTGKEINSVPFLIKFSDYVHNHEEAEFPEAIDTHFLKHQRILHYEDLIEKQVADVVEFISSVASANISASATSKIHKLFSKHPKKEATKITESYVKKLEKDLQECQRQIRELHERQDEMLEASRNLIDYGKQISSSTSLTTEEKTFAKKDEFHQMIGEAAKILLQLKHKNVELDVNQKSLQFQYDHVFEEKEDIRERFIEMAGRTFSPIGSGRSNGAESDDHILPKDIIEMFGKLYLYEWKEIVDALSISGRWKAHIVIQHLFSIVQTCFMSCQHISAQQTKEMLTTMFVPEDNQKDHKQELKYVIEFKRKMSTTCAFNLQKVIIEKAEFQANLIKWGKQDLELLQEILKSPYFNRCVYLSWLMVTQHPPMYMDEGPVRRSYIKRELYQEFTKKGSIIDYCVWPALYVQKDGPLGTKGVVQVY